MNKNLQKVRVKRTGQIGIVNNVCIEVGEKVYTLSTPNGQPIWNGSFRRFSESQIIEL